MEPHFTSKPTLTKEQALQKLQHYCAYAERCHQDVVSKLYELNVWKKEHDAILAALIEDNYLNEERFAKSFAGGHFRTKQWGRNKIVQALKQRGVSPYCIRAGLREIEDADYRDTAQKLFNHKWEQLKGTPNRFVKMKKASDYLLQKGYETQLVNALINAVQK